MEDLKGVTSVAVTLVALRKENHHWPVFAKHTAASYVSIFNVLQPHHKLRINFQCLEKHSYVELVNRCPK